MRRIVLPSGPISLSIPVYRQEWAEGCADYAVLLQTMHDGQAAATLPKNYLATQLLVQNGLPLDNLCGVWTLFWAKPDADRAYQEVLEVLEKLAQDFRQVPDYQRDLAASLESLGTLLLVHGHLQEAERAYRKSLDITEQLVRDHGQEPACHLELVRIRCDLGNLFQASGGQQRG